MFFGFDPELLAKLNLPAFHPTPRDDTLTDYCDRKPWVKTVSVDDHYKWTRFTWKWSANYTMLHELEIKKNKIRIDVIKMTKPEMSEVIIYTDGKEIYRHCPLKDVDDILVFNENSIWVEFKDKNIIHMSFKGKIGNPPKKAVTLCHKIEMTKLS